MSRKEELYHVQTTLGPSFHQHFLIGDRVKVTPLDGAVGKITGVSTHDIICTYIVTLETPIPMRGYSVPASTVVIPGGELELELDS